MPYRRSFRRRRSSRPKLSSIQHSPSTMDQSFLTDKAAIVIAATPNLDAGGSMGSERLSTDRLNDVANGSIVGKITYTMQMEPNTSASGTIEYVCFRTERSVAAPVVGTSPFPTNTEIKDSGLQQMMRSNLPGWTMQFGAFAVSEELPRVKTITCSPNKFGAGKMKDGDYHGIIFFNRTPGTIDWSVQMRFRSYR